jgi:hypothetical protein
MLSPHDPNVLYQAGNRIFRSTDEGQTWTPISPDLTRADPGKLTSSGGELTADNTGAEYYCTVFALAESPLRPGLLWAATDDGLVHVTRDGGFSWSDVTPPDVPEWTVFNVVEPSPHDPDTAYLAGDRHKLDDFRPLLWRTRDRGLTWERLDAGLPENDFCRVIREDPARRDLLFCGTETGVHVSFDGGTSWRSLRGSLPVVPVHDLVVRGEDLVAATHGRSIWILDDLPAVRQHQDQHEAATVHLYVPRRHVRFPSRAAMAPGPSVGRSYRNLGAAIVPFDVRRRPDEAGREAVLVDAGENRASGVTVLYRLGDPGDQEVRITFLDAAGDEVRRFTGGPGDDPDEKPVPGRPPERRPARRAGLNRFVWDTRHEPPAAIGIDPPKDEGPWTHAFGPAVPPGTYEVHLRVGDDVRAARFEIAPDPRSEATPDDLRAQYEHAKRVWRRLSEVNEAVDTIRELRRQLDRWSGEGGEIAGAAASLRESLGEVERELVVVDARGSGRLGSPDRLDSKLRTLLQHASFPARPTAASLAIAGELLERAGEVLGRLDSLLGGRVEEFNDLVRRSGAPALAARPVSARGGARAETAAIGDPDAGGSGEE